LYPVSTSGSGSSGSGSGDQCGCDTNTVSTSQDVGDIRDLENTTILRSQSNLNIGSVSVGNLDFYNSEVTLSFSERAKGWISFKSFVPESGVSINNEYYTFKDGEMYKHHSNLNRNTFYGDHRESSVTLLFNDQPGTVKSFSTLNYEGSQARNKANLTDGEYTNLVERDGWYVSDIKTNLQESSYLEFTGKEDKWFTYIKGDTTTLQNLDEREFSVQGIGNYLRMEVVGEEAKQEVCLTITPNINCKPIPGCMDPKATNYNSNANVDDDSCTYPPEPIYGCTDPKATNYNSNATIDDGSCDYEVNTGVVQELGAVKFGVNDPNELLPGGSGAAGGYSCNSHGIACYPLNHADVLANGATPEPAYGAHVNRYAIGYNGLDYDLLPCGAAGINSGKNYRTESYWFSIGDGTPGWAPLNIGATYNIGWHEIVLKLQSGACSNCLMGGWGVKVDDVGYSGSVTFADINNAINVYDPVFPDDLTRATDGVGNGNSGDGTDYNKSKCSKNDANNSNGWNTAGASNGSASEWRKKNISFVATATKHRFHFYATTNFSQCTSCLQGGSSSSGVFTANTYGSYVGISRVVFS